MRITESASYIRVFQALGLRYAELARQPSTQGFDELLQSLEHQVGEDVNGILVSLRQIRTSSRYLRQLGSKRFRAGRGSNLDHLILYHNTAALHEAGTLRNRVVRMMDHYRAHIAKLEDSDRSDIANNLRKSLLDVWHSLQAMRDEHVHEIGFVPAGVATNDPYARKSEVIANSKSAARRLAHMWTSLATIMENVATFTFELAGLLSIPTTGDKDFEEIFKKMDNQMRLVASSSTSQDRRGGPTWQKGTT